MRDAERRIEILERRLSSVEQLALNARQLANLTGGGRGQGGGSSGGGAWADAAAVTAGGSADLVVHEVRTDGDVDMGERTVHNRYDEDTDAAAGPLILVKNPDGSYLIVGQGCPPGGG